MTDTSLQDLLNIPTPLTHLIQRPLQHHLVQSLNGVRGLLLTEFNGQVYREEIILTKSEIQGNRVADLYSDKIEEGVKRIAAKLAPVIQQLLMDLPHPKERYEHDI